MKRIAQIAAAAILFTALASCDQSSTRASVLWTDVPEMASYVERFNASQRDWQILVEYKANPSTLLITPGRKADLVIARHLTSTLVKDTLVPLDFLFDGGNLAKASFYRRSLDAGMQGDHSKLLPVSIDLPILLFSKSQLPSLPGFSLNREELRGLNAAFDGKVSTKLPSKLAFSPRWESFSLPLIQGEGAAFQEGFQGALTWDSKRLRDGLDLLHSWPGPGWVPTSEFRRKYLQIDPAPVLASGHVQFYPSTLALFESKPWEERRDLDFRYLDTEGRILATDTTVWAGIPSSSLTRGAAERFLAWYFRTDTQSVLLQAARTEDGRAFGLAQGLSALREPNDTALVRAFPDLAGRIPSQDQLTFWEALPIDWLEIRDQVLIPWLESPSATEATLKSALEQHRTQASRN